MGKIIWFGKGLILQMQQCGALHEPAETGGMLVGYINVGQRVVTQLIGPGPNAIHRPEMFEPDHEYQCDRLDAVFEATNGRETYLGDWHTHPDSRAEMSWRDRRTLIHIARKTENSTAMPVMAIIDLRNPWPAHSLRAYLPPSYLPRIPLFRKGFEEITVKTYVTSQ